MEMTVYRKKKDKWDLPKQVNTIKVKRFLESHERTKIIIEIKGCSSEKKAREEAERKMSEEKFSAILEFIRKSESKKLYVYGMVVISPLLEKLNILLVFPECQGLYLEKEFRDLGHDTFYSNSFQGALNALVLRELLDSINPNGYNAIIIHTSLPDNWQNFELKKGVGLALSKHIKGVYSHIPIYGVCEDINFSEAEVLDSKMDFLFLEKVHAKEILRRIVS